MAGQVVAEPARALVVVVTEFAAALHVADDLRAAAAQSMIEEGHGQLGHGVGVLARRGDDRDAARRRRGDCRR